MHLYMTARTKIAWYVPRFLSQMLYPESYLDAPAQNDWT